VEVEALQGYFVDDVFYQQGRRTKIPNRKMVVINVLDIPVDIEETIKADAEFWKEFDRQAKDSLDEELLMADFPRVRVEPRAVELFED